MTENKNIEYRLPKLEDEAALRAYVKEHNSRGETCIGVSMGSGSAEFAGWVAKVNAQIRVPDGEWGRSLVLLCICEGEIVGILSVHYEMSPELREKFGNIGCGVRPSRRGRGLATAMTRRGLEICRAHGMTEVTLGCYKNNAASAKVIANVGGEFVREAVDERGGISRYYTVKL